MVWFDLYPWHSKSWGSIDVRSREVQLLIEKYVSQPIAALNPEWTLAFCKAWFKVLPAIGFEPRDLLGDTKGSSWENQTPSRRVGIFEQPETKSRAVLAARTSNILHDLFNA